MTKRQLNTFIEESKFLLFYDNDWDDDGADKTNIKSYNSAISFLQQYCKNLKSHIYINVLKNGYVYLEFTNTNNQTLFIFFYETPVVTFLQRSLKSSFVNPLSVNIDDEAFKLFLRKF